MNHTYFSILYDEKPAGKKAELYEGPDFFIDLNLDQVVHDITVKCQDYDLKPYYYVLPGNPSTIRYRQEILKDFTTDMTDGFIQFSNIIKSAAKYKNYIELCQHPMQKQKWHIDFLTEYCKALRSLMSTLNAGKLQSKGFQNLAAYLENTLNSEAFLYAERESKQITSEFHKLRYGLHIEPDKVTVLIEPMARNYCRELQKLFGKSKETPDYMMNPLSGKFELSILEQKILDILKEEVPAPFVQMEECYWKTINIADDILLQFEKEVHFYIAFLHYKIILERNGYSFAFPIQNEHVFLINGGYDIALAGKNIYEKKPVISNDVCLENQERFLVITGPNQGGKTTFARALGQIVYFSLMGLMAPCEKAELPMLSGLNTHFCVEESPESGRGKLKEELIRLKEMKNKKNDRCFVILNELFTTAATYDSYLMGEKILDYFHSQNCYGIYVTHIKELAEKKEYVASFVAELDHNDNHTRTYKVTKRSPDGIGYAETLAEKHKMTYCQMKEVLSR